MKTTSFTRKIFSSLLALALVLGLSLVPAASVSAATGIFSPASGPIGTTITVTGADWAASETISSVAVGGVTATHTLTVNGSGALSGNITVPTVSGGAKDIVVTGSVSGAVTFSSAFTVRGSATFSPATGRVGATITVTGAGWAASETVSTVTVAGVTATHTLTVNESGALSGTITVPSVSSGAKDIVVIGSVSGALTFSSAFTVTTNTATFSPVTGRVGATITVTGAGWAASETISSVTVAGLAAAHTLTVNASGALSGTITVPSVSGGAKDIVVTGSVSGAVTFPGAFTVATNTATFSPATGPAGATITVTGAGWAASETISSVTVGGVTATHTLTVDGSGALSGNITVPSVSGGAKDIVVTGSVSGAVTFSSAFTVATNAAVFTPAAGPIGATITVTGAGWSASETISSVTVGGVTATHTLTVDGSGALSGNITVPSVSGGAKDIIITGVVSGAVTFSNAFIVTPGVASRLAFTIQPLNTTVGSAFEVKVAIQDSSENTVASSTAAVTLAITAGTGTAGAVLSGTATVNAVAGVATFSGLRVDRPGAGYTLTATSVGLASATSNAFNVAPPVTSSDISLAAGWNLISLPLVPTSSAIATVLGGISSSVVSVFSYDASAAVWTGWTPSSSGGLTTMTHGKGYWINMSAPATLTITGTELLLTPEIPRTYSVVAGWNLIGFTSTTSRTNGAYLAGTDYRFPIYRYSGGAYAILSASSDNFQTGVGYWVYFNDSGTITL